MRKCNINEKKDIQRKKHCKNVKQRCKNRIIKAFKEKSKHLLSEDVSLSIKEYLQVEE